MCLPCSANKRKSSFYPTISRRILPGAACIAVVAIHRFNLAVRHAGNGARVACYDATSLPLTSNSAVSLCSSGVFDPVFVFLVHVFPTTTIPNRYCLNEVSRHSSRTLRRLAVVGFAKTGWFRFFAKKESDYNHGLKQRRPLDPLISDHLTVCTSLFHNGDVTDTRKRKISICGAIVTCRTRHTYLVDKRGTNTQVS